MRESERSSKVTAALSFLPAFATLVFLVVVFALPAPAPALVKGAYHPSATSAAKTYGPSK